MPYLARHCRVVTFDGRGNGRSDRPDDRGYAEREFAADALAVMDATGDRARVLVSLSLGAQRALLLAADHPERVDGAVFICPAVPLGEAVAPRATVTPWDEELDTDEGWAKYNRHYWLARLPRLPRVLLLAGVHRAALDEADRGLRRLGARDDARDADRHGSSQTGARRRRRCASLAPSRSQCPVLVIHGTRRRDHRRRRAAIALAEATGGELVDARGRRPRPARPRPGEGQPAAARLRRRRRRAGRALGRAARARRKRALYISSPIGLGHAQRDVAIADELRKLHPDLEIDWLAQHPVTAVLEARGERIHPASALLANESRHIESESAEHDLHCFQAIRRMDEILLANFMVFHDLVREERLRPLDRRRGLGARLLPAREPGAEARRLRLADRLRRLAADARRRRARGVPDRRLQRRDDRAHRALPARARPRGLRRQRRTTSCPTRFGPELPRDPRLDRRSTSTSPATSRASTRPSSPTASGCGRARLRRRRAGLHRHGRRLGRRRRTCCAG